MQDVYEELMTLAKRRGFINPSFEIYGGIAGFYDYGPLGAQLKHNVEEIWRRFYILREKCLEVNTPTITIYEVLEASGHVDEFTDLTIDCNKCKHSYKVEDIIDKGRDLDQVIKEEGIRCPNCKGKLSNPYYTNLMFSTRIGVGEGRKAFLRPETAQGIFTNFHLLYRYAREKIPFGVVQIGRGYRNEISPRQGVLRQREFSMAEAEVFFDPLDKTHPRFNDIKNTKVLLLDDDGEKELTLEEAVNRRTINNQALAYYMYLTQEFLLTCGIDKKKFRFRKHRKDELAHYATECWDAELYSERFGWVECVGIADRSAYDINAHIKSSGVDMYATRRYDTPRVIKTRRIIAKMDELGPLFKKKAAKVKSVIESLKPDDAIDDGIKVKIDGEEIKVPRRCYDIVEGTEKVTGEKFIPHVIEPSYGIDRIIYFILEHNYKVDKRNNEDYHILSLKPCIAPIKTGVFPLVNEDSLVRIAKDIDKRLTDAGVITYYDEAGSIGRRYARMDEIGTPFCITVDYDSLNDESVTIRERDTTSQDRVKIKDIVSVIIERLHI